LGSDTRPEAGMMLNKRFHNEWLRRWLVHRPQLIRKGHYTSTS
jgi:hypothetical protein